MSNHGWVACTSDLTHGHLSDCDDRGDAVGGFGFAPVEVVAYCARYMNLKIRRTQKSLRINGSYMPDYTNHS